MMGKHPKWAGRKAVIRVGAAILTAALMAGCGEKPDEAFASPKSTLERYMSIAESISESKEINTGYVHDALQCFTKADREWFQNNYKTFPMDEISGNAAEAVSEPVLRAAMVFMLGVVPRGPRGPADVAVVSQTDTDATLKVNEFITVPLVKEGPNWRIRGLFGAKNE